VINTLYFGLLVQENKLSNINTIHRMSKIVTFYGIQLKSKKTKEENYLAFAINLFFKKFLLQPVEWLSIAIKTMK